MMNDWKDCLGVVYSTAADFDYRTAESEEAETLAPAAQQLRVRIEKKGRGGKTATLVSGFVGTSADLADLGRTLKPTLDSLATWMRSHGATIPR